MKSLIVAALLILSRQTYAQEIFPLPEEEAETNTSIVLRLATTYCSEAKMYLNRELKDQNNVQLTLKLETKVYNDLCDENALPKSFQTEPVVNGIFLTYVRLQNSWARIAKTLEPETELHSKYFYEVREDLLYSREVISPYSTDSEFYKYYSQTLANSELFDLAQTLRRQAIKANESLRQE